MIKNGFYPTISSGEAGGFIQDCHPHSSYLIPHHASIDMCYRAGNAGSLHGWCVSPLQNHPICLRVTCRIGDIGGGTCVKTRDLC